VTAGGSKPILRRARAADWPDVHELLDQADALHARLAPDYFHAGARPEAEWRRLLSDDAACALIAESPRPGGGAAAPGVVIGVVAGRIYETPPDPTMVARRRCHVDTLVVDATHRRRGTGRALLDEIGAWARARGAAELLLTTWAGNAEADGFYDRLGYRTLSTVRTRKL